MARICWVVVLGDFGRSPRMQYHTWSLAEAGYDVHVLASPGSAPIQPVLDACNVHLHYLAPPPPWVARLPGLLSLAAKGALQALAMLWAVLMSLPRPGAILMQNPPAIPVMLVLWVAALRHRAALVIDWHNLTYSVLALKHGHRRWLISVAKAYEKALGRRGAAHFCVTKAMKEFLASDFGIDATVLYDRPPDAFRPLPLEEKHETLVRLAPQLRAAAIGASRVLGRAATTGAGAEAAAAAADAETPFTQPLPGGGAADAPDRPALVVSSTSWTPDEDFGILLEAAQQYDAAAADDGGLPDALFVITGRGAQREEYLAKISRLTLRRCAFASMWLEPGDYPLLLGCADLGVCLHTSSSGLDLPMKVVDMFGAGLPVCAVRFDCIRELVEDGRTGLLFDGPQQLAEQLQQLLRGFDGSGGGGQLAAMRSEVKKVHDGWRWRSNWQEVAAPVIAAACERGRE